jgi:hypothetical protein
MFRDRASSVGLVLGQCVVLARVSLDGASWGPCMIGAGAGAGAGADTRGAWL